MSRAANLRYIRCIYLSCGIGYRPVDDMQIFPKFAALIAEEKRATGDAKEDVCLIL